MFFKSRKEEPPAMTLEGVLGPNGRLDEAPGMRVAAPDAMCIAHDGQLLFSDGNAVRRLGTWGGEPQLWRRFDLSVTALFSSPGGLVAVGLASGQIVVCDAAGQAVSGWTLQTGFSSVVDGLFLSEDELVLVDCGYAAGETVLSIAPWDNTPRGNVVALKRSGETRTLASGLHCPMGICRDADGGLIVTELERAHIADTTGKVRQSGYPAYLGRIRQTSRGFALACLSRRDPLIEFLKTEVAFVAEMKAGIDPRHWISPRISPEFSHDFPIELGATRLFGEVKAWAPSFSYGLMIELDNSLMPTRSAHSRANGIRHAISDVVEWYGAMLVVSKASGEILNLGAREDQS